MNHTVSFLSSVADVWGSSRNLAYSKPHPTVRGKEWTVLINKRFIPEVSEKQQVLLEILQAIKVNFTLSRFFNGSWTTQRMNKPFDQTCAAVFAFFLLCQRNILITKRFIRIKKIGKGVNKVSMTCFEICRAHISRCFVPMLVLTSGFDMEIKFLWSKTPLLYHCF